ncbi:MAG: arabinan endo-1,5-alpha-L-arabinosidase [Hyphomicrobiales bacterium]|nr:arabinan endo-1,5-alpha-L-arabinosidase [Hyphomicrobiales bacterium]
MRSRIMEDGMPALVLLAILMMLAAPADAAELQPTLAGDTRIHDPRVIEVGGRYVAFGTGEDRHARGAIRTKTSPDGVNWSDAGTIGKGAPQWARPTLGYQPNNVWAPSVSRRGDLFFLYYALSSFGGNASAIGLTTNAAFDPSRPAEGWEDQGLVIASNPKDDFNAIDPFRFDATDGRAWLVFGSFWSGIKLAELDPSTGKLIRPETPLIALASRQGGAIEAASLLAHDGKFYLFVSFDQCCRGVASTYNLRVGGSDRLEGPYVDKDGRAMLDGGGSLLLGATGRFIGPGGGEAVKTSKGAMLAYHYYDGADAGVSKLQFSPIHWSADGWPELDPLPP